MESKKTDSGKKIRFPISLRISAYFLLFTLLAAAVLSYLFYLTAVTRVEQDIKQRLCDIVSTAAQSIDPEIHNRLTLPEHEGNEDYLQIRNLLQRIKNNSSDIYFIYTMRKNELGEIRFVVDAEEDPEAVAHLGENYDDPGPVLAANFSSLSEAKVEKETYEDEWGVWLSGYAPFFNPDGSRAGVMGVDISAATITEYKSSLVSQAVLVYIIMLPIILAGGFLVGRRIGKPIIAISKVAERIGAGELEARSDVESSDETGLLANNLNAMAISLKKHQDAMAELAHKYRSIFDNATEGIFQTTIEGKLITANQSLAFLLGYDSAEQFLQLVTDLASQVYLRQKDRQQFREIILNKGDINHFKVQLKKRSGEPVWVEINARIVYHAVKDPVIEGMVLDVTERLAKEAAEREREAAREASKAKSMFLANMSHEIRTPMNAIVGLTDLTLKTELNQRQHDYMRKLKSASHTLLALINDILDFSKIEAGRLEMETIKFSLFDVMANLSEMFAHKAHEKDLELIVTVEDGTPNALIGDPTRLGQVLINLVGNAIKFTEEGEIIVTVKNLEDDDLSGDERKLEFSIKDTGIGIDQERQGTIFDTFTQADSSTTRKFGGTGLGLSICQKLVTLMNGSIRVESEPGKGSAFIFTIKVNKQEDSKQQKLEMPLDLRGLRVLVVDDNQTSLDILSQTIESFNMEVKAALSGEEALKILQNEPNSFDLILLDWRMPGLNGMATAKKIRQELNLNKQPIVCMVSAYGREDIMQQQERNLLDAFLHKPVNQSFLFDTIVELFNKGDHRSVVIDTQNTPSIPAKLRGATALVVEDNSINQELAVEWLNEAGIHSMLANNGKEAIEILSSKPLPDLVFMDVQMPVMDGLTATQEIRKQDNWKDLIIIAMTAHALKGDRERCLEAGMNDYLSKPIDPKKLYDLLDRYIPEEHSGFGKETVFVQNNVSPDELPTLPDSLPGVDIGSGLYRANNNARLYSRLLGEFARDYKNARIEIEQLLGAENISEATIVSHSIKGIAGNLGAQKLHQIALQIESSLKKNQTVDKQTLKEFGEELQFVCKGIKSAGLVIQKKDDNRIINDQPVDVAALKADLNQLLFLIEDDLSAAEIRIQSIYKEYKNSQYSQLLGKISDMLDSFETEDALVQTRSIIDELKETEEK